MTIDGFDQTTEIPPDIFELVTSGFDCNQLAKLRAVSKQWKGLIDELYGARLAKPRSIFTRLSRNPLTLALPQHVHMEVVQAIQFGRSWAVQGTQNTCYSISDSGNSWLGVGTIHSLDPETLIFKEETTLKLMRDESTFEIAARQFETAGGKLLVSSNRRALVYDRSAEIVTQVDGVSKCTLSPSGELVYEQVLEQETFIIQGDERLGRLEGRERLLGADEQGVLIGHGNALSRLNKAGERITLTPPEEWLAIKTDATRGQAKVKCIGDQCIFYTKEGDTTKTSYMGREFNSNGRSSPEIVDGSLFVPNEDTLHVIDQDFTIIFNRFSKTPKLSKGSVVTATSAELNIFSFT
ncbi:MAG: hypothetical protein S4CHLAM81_03680 [Chlamydiales bacterium]|nr:hypothetical protein [Chlamydiales bacterium]MCH9635157.1 hypothetical protein [Chlamydiales bacterium]